MVKNLTPRRCSMKWPFGALRRVGYAALRPHFWQHFHLWWMGKVSVRGYNACTVRVGRRFYPARARGRPLPVPLTGLQRRHRAVASVRAVRRLRLTPRGGRGKVHRGRVWEGTWITAGDVAHIGRGRGSSRSTSVTSRHCRSMANRVAQSIGAASPYNGFPEQS
jgi:hypothetical protein